jgi:geranylgeranyl diphosphate synthase type II
MRTAEELRADFEAYMGALSLSSSLGRLEDALRYSLEPGGKRIRPVLCLAVTQSAGGDVERAFPAAAALELVHTFSLVHDDLPALDDDSERRGRPSSHVAFGEESRCSQVTRCCRGPAAPLTYDDPGVARDSSTRRSA